MRLQADLGAVRATAQDEERDAFVVDGVSVEVDVTWQPGREAPAFWLLDEHDDVEEHDVEHRNDGRSASNRQHLVVHLGPRPRTVGTAGADDGHAATTDVLPPAPTTEPDR